MMDDEQSSTNNTELTPMTPTALGVEEDRVRSISIG